MLPNASHKSVNHPWKGCKVTFLGEKALEELLKVILFGEKAQH